MSTPFEKRRFEILKRRAANNPFELDKIEREHRIDNVVTSSTGEIKGRKIVRQIKVIYVSEAISSSEAEILFRTEVDKVGGNGAVNLKFHRHPGGTVSVQGDAVFLE